jgi:hypothetical protein
MLRYMKGYADWKRYYFGEGHPNPAGARRIAEVIFDLGLDRRLEAAVVTSRLSREDHLVRSVRTRPAPTGPAARNPSRPSRRPT